jgi:hypothetical protein
MFRLKTMIDDEAAREDLVKDSGETIEARYSRRHRRLDPAAADVTVRLARARYSRRVPLRVRSPLAGDAPAPIQRQASLGDRPPLAGPISLGSTGRWKAAAPPRPPARFVCTQ